MLKFTADVNSLTTSAEVPEKSMQLPILPLPTRYESQNLPI
jgi:hypothetical protein